MFQEVSTRAGFPDLELAVLAFWKERDIFHKSLKQREGRPPFVFYEGPPTANNLPGIHHVLARALKDLFPRYKTMRGFYVDRKAGWDTHGLPVEIEVEKQLKFTGKQDIEKFGIEAFNKLCRESVFKYIDQFADLTERMGYWVDLDKAYRTLDTTYMESVWWILKQLWDKELLFKGFKVVPYCPRDQTPLSSHELALGYQDDVEDPSVYVKFELEDEPDIVHTAGAYGVDDLELSLKKGIPVRHVVDLAGRFRPEVEPFAGLFVKKADPKIIEDLTRRGLMYRAETIQHTYPFCWRCGTPLLYYALTSWFIKTTAVKDELIRNNNLVNWVPPYVGTGRMANWLETLVDWSLSRWRYWGTPLPIWVCEQCDERRCVGSVAELGLTLEDDLHRPYIDRVTLPCVKCGGVMRRVTDLIDVWFDSGSMPVAQYHYPFENQQLFKVRFPADFIAEGVDQTRGWFFSLLATGTMLFDQPAFKNVIVNGTVLDKQGRKMSKSLKNSGDPMEVMSKFGADATRWYFFSAVAIGNDYRFDLAAVLEVRIRRGQAHCLSDALPGAGQRVAAAGALHALRLGAHLSEPRGRSARPTRERPSERLAGGGRRVAK